MNVRRGYWTHVAVTCDGFNLKLYVNGVLGAELERGASEPLLPAQNGLFFAGVDAGSTFLGRMADARYWSVVRSEAEIAASMGRRLNGSEDGLCGCWPLDDGSGTTLANLVPGGTEATHVGGGWMEMANYPISPDGAESNADSVLAVNSAASTVDTRLTPGPLSAFTFEAWVNPRDIYECDGENTLLAVYSEEGINGDFTFRLQSGRVAMWIRGAGSVAGSTTFEPGRWYHVAGVYDGTTMKVYCNGRLEGTAEVTAPQTFVQGVHLIIGGVTRENPFRGSLRDVSFWNLARTSEEILDDSASQLVGDEDGLVGYWPLDDASGNYSRNLATVFGVDGYSVAANRAIDYTNPDHEYTMSNLVYRSTAEAGGQNSRVKIETVAFTLEGWVRPETTVAQNTIMAQYKADGAANDLIFAIGEDGCPFVFMRKFNGASPVLRSSTLLPRNKWSHLCVSFDGLTMRLYVNGALDCEMSGSEALTIPPSDTNLRICGLFENEGFVGCLGDMRCWEVARTAEEIQTTCRTRLTGFESGLVGYWPLDGGGKNPSVIESVVYPRINQAPCAGTWVVPRFGYPFANRTGLYLMLR